MAKIPINPKTLAVTNPKRALKGEQGQKDKKGQPKRTMKRTKAKSLEQTPKEPQEPDGVGQGPLDGGGDGSGDDNDDDSSSSSGSDSSEASFTSAKSEQSTRTLKKISKVGMKTLKQRSRCKEHDEIKGPGLPSVPGWRTWINTILQNINTASGRPDDKALIWAHRVLEEKVSEAELWKTSNRFAVLSRKIATFCRTNSARGIGSIDHAESC